MHDIARYYPIVTTVLSFAIASEMFSYYRQEKSTHLLFWIIGVCTFGLAALGASINVLFGWSPANLKFWYISGALLGGFPLAQGIVYFLMNRTFAHISTVFFALVIAVAAVAVVMTPITLPPDFDHELTGRVFTWKWVRLFSPIVNTYALLMVLGGGSYTAYKYYSGRDTDDANLATANIALGGILPGIGGTLFTRMGYVNVLFVLDFLALAVIYSGYRILKRNA